LAAVSPLGTASPLLADQVSPKDLKKAQQQTYIEDKDGSKTLLLSFGKRVSKVDSPLVNGPTLITSQIPMAPISSDVFARDATYFKLVPKTHKPNVDKVFLRQLIARQKS
jgi:ATP-binding cassette subfamily D (ALD) long-chain fatty acid import protein